MDNNIRRAVIGAAIGATMLIAFSGDIRRMAGRMVSRGTNMMMNAADETTDVISSVRNRMKF